MFDGFETTDIDVPDKGYETARIRVVHGGNGPPLLLLHGNPLTHVSWHKVANALAQNFHVVATDLRGYGDSIGPHDGGPSHINYSFRAMAQDQVDVMAELGYDKFQVAGHDRGARTTHRMCLDHPTAVQRAAIIDVLPNRHIWNNVTKDWAMRSWHWIFMTQPYDLPERMMSGVPAEYFMEKKLSKKGIGLRPFAPEAFAEYVRCFNEKTIHASCEDYRACPTSDLTMDEEDFAASKKISCPLLILWGSLSHTGTVFGDVLSIWQDYSTAECLGGPIVCGHYVPEEAPQELLKWFQQHFDATS